jgi:hypothetical protein
VRWGRTKKEAVKEYKLFRFATLLCRPNAEFNAEIQKLPQSKSGFRFSMLEENLPVKSGAGELRKMS